MARIPTVRINHGDDPNDYIIINESDFDPETMTKWGEGPPPPPPPPTDPAIRLASIVEAIGDLDPDNDEHWTGEGDRRKPQVKPLEEILGWDLTGAERDEATEARKKMEGGGQ